MLSDYANQIERLVDSVSISASKGEIQFLEDLKGHLEILVKIIDTLEKEGVLTVQSETGLTPKAALSMYSRVEASVVLKAKANKPLNSEERFHTQIGVSLLMNLIRDLTKAMLFETFLNVSFDKCDGHKKASCH